MAIQWTNEKSIHSGRKVGAVYPAFCCCCLQIHVWKYVCMYVNVRVCVLAHMSYVCALGLEHKQKTGLFSFRSDMNKQCRILLCFKEYYLVLHYLTRSLGSFFFLETRLPGYTSHISAGVWSLSSASKRLEVICVFSPLLSFVHVPIFVGRD